MRRLIALTAAIWLSSAIAQDETQQRIDRWQETAGISEARAYTLTKKAISEDLTEEDGGQVCGAEQIWGLERERGGTDTRFAVTAFAKGPYMGCAGTETYDCKVIFTRTGQVWNTSFIECEPMNLRDEE